MSTLVYVAASLGILGTWLFILNLVAKQKSEDAVLDCVVYAAWRELRSGEVLHDDLKRIYEEETKTVAGFPGVLTDPESHALVAALVRLAGEGMTPMLDDRIYSLRRSLPQGWVVGAGNFYRYVPAVILLAVMIGLVRVAGGTAGPNQPSELTLTIVLGIVSIGYLIPNAAHWTMYFRARARRATLARELAAYGTGTR